MTLNEMAPAIGGTLAAVGGYLYARHIRRSADRARAAKATPAE